jgi:DNA repair exonuclease SbcCD ATPase subunit
MSKQERITVLEKDINQIQLDLKRQEENLRDVQHDVDMAQIKVDNFEIDPYNYEDQFCEMLDEQGDIEIGTFSFSPSDVLREMDPIAYRTGLLDYVDGFDIEDDEEFAELKENLEELESDRDSTEELIAELEEELERLQEELEELENELENE